MSIRLNWQRLSRLANRPGGWGRDGDQRGVRHPRAGARRPGAQQKAPCQRGSAALAFYGQRPIRPSVASESTCQWAQAEVAGRALACAALRVDIARARRVPRGGGGSEGPLI